MQELPGGSTTLALLTALITLTNTVLILWSKRTAQNQREALHEEVTLTRAIVEADVQKRNGHSS